MSVPLDYCGVVGYTAECRPDMSTRPEFYSGRGVNRGDLNERHLKAIHDGLKRYHGDDIAVSFVRMVQSLSDLSATNFLRQLQVFCGQGGQWAGSIRETDLDVGPDGPGREGVALASIFGRLGRGSSPEETRLQSELLKDDFLRAIGQPTCHHKGGAYRMYGPRGYNDTPNWSHPNADDD